MKRQRRFMLERREKWQGKSEATGGSEGLKKSELELPGRRLEGARNYGSFRVARVAQLCRFWFQRLSEAEL
jgi:hypothetical protein